MKQKLPALKSGPVVLGLVGLSLTGLACFFFPIPITGPAGSMGFPGLDAGSDLPGTVITIQEVKGGDFFGPLPVSAGGPISVTFMLATDAGDPIDIDQLDRFSIYVSGPATDYQRVIPPEDERDTSVTDNGGGSYTYTFPGGFPTTYAAPINDSGTFGPDDGELQGMAILPGTYTVGMEARRSFSIEGETVRDAGDATFDFPVGGATLEPRQVVLQSSCEDCHNKLTLHGGNRFSVTLCVMCHTKGAEDRISADPAKATPDVHLLFARMIHRIHKGVELPRVSATENGGDPYRHVIIGFGENPQDFSDIHFPRLPGGTGFNEQTRNCDACHGGAAQGDRYYTNPNRAACGGCHDDLDFTTGTILNFDNATVAAGTLTQGQLGDAQFRANPGHAADGTGGTAHTFTDDQCTSCHATGSALDPRTLHLPPLANDANTTGLRVEVQSVAGNSGAGFFLPGDFPVVTFQFFDRNDNPVDIGDIASVRLVISGPVENYQKLIPAAGSTVSLIGAGGVPAMGTGPFTYTSPEAIPAAYPAPLNDSAAFDFAGGSGELSGRMLDNGSYTVMVYAYRQFDIDGSTYRESSLPGLFPIRIGSAGTAAAYPGYVTDERCNACHGNLRIHGNTRRGVQKCVMCHTGGAEDIPGPPTSGTEAPEADTINFKVMIHKIHNARNLEVVEMGGAYDIIGFGGGLDDFSTGLLCSMPGETRHCTVCHATDAWKTPVERSDTRIWKVACTACHDGAATAAHVDINTLNVGIPGGWTESCPTCHHEGAVFGVDRVHLVR